MCWYLTVHEFGGLLKVKVLLPTKTKLISECWTKTTLYLNARQPKHFPFFFRWASSIAELRLCDDDFHTKQQHFPLSSAPAHQFFYSFEVSRGSSNWSLKNYGFICNAIFFFTCTHAHKALSNEMYLLLKITKIEIPSVGMETGMPIYIVDSVFELMPNQWFFNTAYISLLCVKWQTSAEACTCC